MISIVARESLLRKLAFPRLIIPTSATLTAAMTFGVNLVVVAGFVAWNGIAPQPDWLLLVAAPARALPVHARRRARSSRRSSSGFATSARSGSSALQLLFYATPIIYPVGFLPPWAQTIAFLNPFTQVLQDIRAIVLYRRARAEPDHGDRAFGPVRPARCRSRSRSASFVVGLVLFRREEPWFAERV